MAPDSSTPTSPLAKSTGVVRSAAEEQADRSSTDSRASAITSDTQANPEGSRRDAGIGPATKEPGNVPQNRISADRQASSREDERLTDHDQQQRTGEGAERISPIEDETDVSRQSLVERLDEDEGLNNCGPIALGELIALTGSSVVHLPERPAGRNGMSAREFEDAAGAPLQRFDDHASIAEYLHELGHGSAALVVDTYHGPADKYGVGAHAYLLHNKDGEIQVAPALDRTQRAMPSADTDVRSIHAVLYTGNGRPHRLPADRTTGAENFGTVRIGNTPKFDWRSDVEFRRASLHSAKRREGSSVLPPKLVAGDSASNFPKRHQDPTDPAGMSEVRRGKQRDMGEREPDDPSPPRDVPVIEITPPDDDPSDPVKDFGTQRDGAQDLVHITPVPQRMVEWLHEQVFRVVEGDRGPDEEFRSAVRRVLTARLLSSEWSRVLSRSGMPLRVKYQGKSYPVALRLRLRAIGPSKEQIAPMPDGPPVGIQRWAFGISETADTASSSDLRSLSYAYAHTWDADHGPLSSISLTPEIDVTHNQLSTGVTVGSTVQPMTIIRSKGRSSPFDYEMAWELRRGDGLSDLLSPELPAKGDWEPVAGDVPDKLLVWFPNYLAKADGLPTIDHADPSTVPAPIDRVVGEVPLSGVVNFPNHDQLLADVMSSFGTHLGDISDRSGEQLREFFSEGNIRSTIPLSLRESADPHDVPQEGGSADSPTLYTSSGKAIGYLRMVTVMHGGDEITGPTTEKSVLESYVLRSLRVQGSSTIANSLGGAMSLGLGFGAKHSAPDTGIPSRGGQVTIKGGGSQKFSHTINYGGSARIAHSLRTGEPLLHVTPEMTVHISLVRPDSLPLEAAEGTPLHGGHDYPVNMLVPSLRTLGHLPTENRYLPSEILHLRQLGVSTTPLRVDGTEPLFAGAKQWLSTHGFFPSDHDDSGLLDRITQDATRAQRLANVRKFDQMSSRLGLRSEADEMVEGGATTWFELPTPTGTQRVSIKLIAERRYTDTDPHTGASHDWTLPKIQTLNYSGSTIPGDEQFTETPRAWNFGGNASITNPLDGKDRNLWFQGLNPDYTRTGQSSTVRDSNSGTGHEYYTLSPTENGTQIFTVPVTYRMEITYSHGDAPAPAAGDGTMRLAVPTYRTLSEKPADATPPAPATVRDLTDEDTERMSLPSPGRTTEKGVLRLPETALLDRVAGSKELRKTVVDLIDNIKADIEADTARDADSAPRIPGAYPDDSQEVDPSRGNPAAGSAVRWADEVHDAFDAVGDGDRMRRITRSIPGAFPDDAEEIELPRWNPVADPSTSGTFPRDRHEFDADDTVAEGETDPTAAHKDPADHAQLPDVPRIVVSDPSGATVRDTARADDDLGTEPVRDTDIAPPIPDDRQGEDSGLTWSGVRDTVSGSAHWAVDQATGVGKWIWRNAFGEPATNPESMAHEVTHTALSPHHVNADALRIFRDSYVIEGANTPGTLAGTDITVEVTGYLTDVKLLEQPPKMDGERWLQSVNGTGHTDSRQRGNQLGGALTGSYGKSEHSFIPGGAYHYQTSDTTSSTAADTAGVFRVTTEDTTPVHRFSASAHYVVNVRVGTRNIASGLIRGGPRADRTRVVDIPDAVEFLLVDNDLQNHPDLLALVYANNVVKGSNYEVREPNTPDRGLPSSYIESGGMLGFGTVTDVNVEGGRKGLQDLAHRLVEEQAPGATTSGTANYQPGVLTRINEHTTTLGLRTLPNAGPEGRTAFHFIDRSSWLGPRLVEVAFTARPAPGADLDAIRGKRVTSSSGLDNIFGHSTGDGAALDVPGVTRTSKVRQRGHQVDFTASGQSNGHRPKFDLGVQRQSNLSEIQNSARELRAWQRSFGNTSEFPVPYEYGVEVSSRPLDEAMLTRLVRGGIAGVALSGHAAGVLPPLDISELTRPMSVSSGTRNADTLIRFNTSETPDGDTVTGHITPSIHQSDPAAPRPAPAEGEVAIDMERGPELQALLDGPSWVPSRPIEIYEFGGAKELAQALRQVDPSLATDENSLGNRSSEGMVIRLASLAASNRLTLQGPAATAPFLRAEAPQDGHVPSPSRIEGENSADTKTSVKFTLYSPRIEKTSKDIAIDHIELSTDGFQTQADNSLNTTASFGINNPYTSDGNNRGTPTIPLTGDHADLGQYAAITSVRRELLRFGTPMEGSDGSGTEGHRARAVGVLEVRGPKGVLWVTGDVLFRTTENPTAETPRADLASTEEPTGGTETEPIGDTEPPHRNREEKRPDTEDRAEGSDDPLRALTGELLTDFPPRLRNRYPDLDTTPSGAPLRDNTVSERDVHPSQWGRDRRQPNRRLIGSGTEGSFADEVDVAFDMNFEPRLDDRGLGMDAMMSGALLPDDSLQGTRAAESDDASTQPDIPFRPFGAKRP